MSPSIATTDLQIQFERILLTGAAGNLGRVLTKSLKPFAKELRLSDLHRPEGLENNEAFVECDLADKAAVYSLVQGCDAIVHMGGISTEHPFELILEANIRGVFHIYEAARRHDVKRVVFASSNHVTGFYERVTTIDADAPKRPDGYYGLSKSYGEDLSRFYFDRYGIETACLRIGSAYERPKDERMLHTWLSFADLTELIRCGLFTPDIGHSIVYGASGCRDPWWDNKHAAHLGFRATDSSERFQNDFPADVVSDGGGRAQYFQGGGFVTAGPF